MRYLVYGAGAVGGTIAARLQLSGRDVAAVARGNHLDSLQRDGLRFATPEGQTLVRIAVAGSAAELRPQRDDVVILAVKGQDTASALDELAAAAPPEAAIVCAQNGVDNERQALRRFEHVYGMLVYLPAQHLEPGVVQAFSAPVHGVLDVGRAAGGADELCGAIARDLEAAGFASRELEDVMAWKRAKLLRNLGNALDALVGRGEDVSAIERRATEEALACFAAAGLGVVPDAEATARHALLSPPVDAVGSAERGGSSSWQSVARGVPIETDWLNGEVVLLGRLHGVPTPVNEALQLLAGRLARNGGAPGSGSSAEIEAAIAGES